LLLFQFEKIIILFMNKMIIFSMLVSYIYIQSETFVR
jgi:hypothetical protein